MIDLKRIISVRLVQLRLDAKLSQEEFAVAIGISRSAVRGWEIGEYLPNAIMLQKISEFYKVPIDYLYGRELMGIIPGSKLPREITLQIGILIRTIEEQMS